MARRGCDDPERIQIDPWPAGAFGSPTRRAGGSAGACPTSATTPEDNGYARPVEGVVGFVDMARGEVLEVLDTGVVPLPPESRQLLPRGPARPARRPAAARDHPARGPELHAWRATWCAGSAGRCGCPMDSVEGLVLHQVGYEDDGRVRPDPVPGLGQRDGRPLRRPRARCTAGRTPSTPASGGSGGWPTRSPWAVTASARSTTSTPSSPPSGASPTWCRTPSACTRRTTGSSGSTTTGARVAPRCAGRAGWWSARSPPSATTTTASSGTSTSTGRSSSR